MTIPRPVCALAVAVLLEGCNPAVYVIPVTCEGGAVIERITLLPEEGRMEITARGCVDTEGTLVGDYEAEHADGRSRKGELAFTCVDETTSSLRHWIACTATLDVEVVLGECALIDFVVGDDQGLYPGAAAMIGGVYPL
jgi:hypothetical protein